MHQTGPAKQGPLRGITLVELLVALALSTMAISAAVPHFARWIVAMKVMQEAQHLANDMNLARSEAIKRGQRVNLCKSADGRQCTPGSAWNAGWIMHADPSASGQIDSMTDLIRAREPSPAGVTVSANRPLADYVSYTPYGHPRLLNGALQIGTLTVCASDQNAVDVVLSAGGRARIAKTGTICP